MTLIGGLFGLIGLALCRPARRARLRRAIGPVAGAYARGARARIAAAVRRLHPPAPVQAGAVHGLRARGSSVAHLLGYVVPGQFTILGGQLGQRWGPDGNPWYFGVPLLVLLIVFLITERHRRRTWVLAAGLVLTLVLSIGGSLAVFGVPVMPWRLVSALPVLRPGAAGKAVVYAFLCWRS